MTTQKNSVFDIMWNDGKQRFPPDQLFKPPDFEFLLTSGGSLADNSLEYERLMNVFQQVGEKVIYITENTASSDNSFKRELSIDSDFEFYKHMEKDYDPFFGLTTGDFFVYGKDSGDWGIYMCEHPTINIIGCRKQYLKDFRKAFGILGNGFNELDEFISEEFQSNPGLKEQLIKNYKLKIDL